MADELDWEAIAAFVRTVVERAYLTGFMDAQHVADIRGTPKEEARAYAGFGFDAETVKRHHPLGSKNDTPS